MDTKKCQNNERNQKLKFFKPSDLPWNATLMSYYIMCQFYPGLRALYLQKNTREIRYLSLKRDEWAYLQDYFKMLC